MSGIKYEIIKKVGVHSKSASKWVERANPPADTSKWEGESDELVYQLCGLTEDEVKIVEGA